MYHKRFFCDYNIFLKCGKHLKVNSDLTATANTRVIDIEFTLVSYAEDRQGKQLFYYFYIFLFSYKLCIVS